MQISTKEFTCEFCNSKLKTKRNLDYRKISCEKKNINIKQQEDNKLLHDKINELNLVISDFNNESIKKDLEIVELKGMLKYNKENHILKKQINNEDMTFKLILENSDVINIGIRNDGYINATQL